MQGKGIGYSIKGVVYIVLVALISSILPVVSFAAEYTPPDVYSAPQNVGVVFNDDISDSGRWSFDIGYAASGEVRKLMEAVADGRFEGASYDSLGIAAQIDYKLDSGKWRSEMSGYEEWVMNSETGFDAAAGNWAASYHIYDGYFTDIFPDEVLPGGKSYFDQHTMNFRIRFYITFHNSEKEKDYEYYSPWSSVVSYNNNQKVEDPAALINHPPKLLSVELKKADNGEPYLDFKADTAHADVQILNSISNQRVFTNVWIKVNNGEWIDAGTYLWMKEQFTIEAKDYFGDVKDYSAAIYEAKFRYSFDYTYYPKAGKSGDIYSPFSNALAKGMPAYKGASNWAITELNRAAEYGFITDKIKDNMKAPITREEFAEVAIKLYEAYTKKTAVPADSSVFVDTKNPEIFKAYALKIVNGTNTEKKLFSPTLLTTRQEVSTMLYRAVKAINPDADLSTAGAPVFTDQEEIGSWAFEPVKYMSKQGFIKGTGAGAFDPKGTCTREMAVAIAVRVYEKSGGQAR
ncbi:MAG TPA: S-layer homology domain-containing protein [Clostridiales bacterium]|nr:S-layer homology domain-containing protein [Clostridiales bacterium]